MDIRTGRPVTLAAQGMVTSPHSLASSAGLDVLRAGGSAIDAAIATAAVLAVVYPHMTGLGGDAFWLIHEGIGGEVKYLRGGGKAAATATIAALRGRGFGEIPLRGIVPATLTVPGAVASWIEAHRAHGRLPLTRVLDAAIGYASDGFPVTARLASFIEMMREELLAQREAAMLFFPDGSAPRPGARLTNRNLARTLQAIAEQGWSGFYEGPVAAEMARFSQGTGGFFAQARLRTANRRLGRAADRRFIAASRSSTRRRRPRGFTVLEMLNLIEPHDLRRMDLLGPDRVHLLVQAKQIAYHDRDLLLADPDFAEVPAEMLISKPYASRRSRLIDPGSALRWDQVPSSGSLAGDTVYLAAVDRDGNAVSLIQSLYGAFGSCVVAGEHRRGSPEQRRLFLPRSAASQPARAWKNPLAYPDRLDGEARWQAVERARLHGRRWPAADSAPALLGDDRSWSRYPGSDRDAALPVRPLRAGRSARHPAHGGPLSCRDHAHASSGAVISSIAGTTGTRWRATRTASRSMRQAAS